ncbi:hypothetical protein HYH03_018552 [Edaphochlamys debaryana]|uniref:Protein kinase domain-containing protein n=1 Tax=Edaphochlamys debaryana TaxID=47281 RepID=A0A835XDJ2_9CHLO|nr:hypothetical protein HYH03_018552 [Edaphochlamys debaryana]|eukprot:KAG2482507.1 hypothetical protein HYH03_018552 [Edaphochlamys debaryana]
MGNCIAHADAGVSFTVSRDPVKWLLTALQLQISKGPTALEDVEVAVEVCDSVWAVAAAECTFRTSAYWPVAGLTVQAGSVFFPLLIGPTSIARRLNLTCPPESWTALLAAAGGVGPCGTATIRDGPSLLAALSNLQPLHSRLLLTIAANITLAGLTEPTPQRLDPAPHDSSPLVRLYRSTTLAGVGASSTGPGTEIDFAKRRNVFDLTVNGSAGPGSPMLVLSDLALPNLPGGPVRSWPMGLILTSMYFTNLDRRPTAPQQLLMLRSVVVFPLAEIMYFGAWSARLTSIVAAEFSSALWMAQIHAPPVQVRDLEGYAMVKLADVGSECWVTYNSTISPVPLLTPTIETEFGFSSPLLRPPPSGTGTQLVPGTALAFAADAAELLRLVQTPPPDGDTRVVFLLGNITLQRSAWPQPGAALHSHLVLLGPQTGDLGTWLDASAAVPMLQPPANTTTAIATTTSSGSSTATAVLRVDFARLGLRLSTMPSPLRTNAAGLGSSEAAAWAGGCTAAPAASTGSTLSYGLHSCAVQAPDDLVAAIAAFSCPQAACSAAGRAALGQLAGPACALAAAASGSGPDGAAKLPPPLRAMLRAAFVVDGQAAACGAPPGGNSSSAVQAAAGPWAVEVVAGQLDGVALDGVYLAPGEQPSAADGCSAAAVLMAAWQMLAPVAAEPLPSGGGGGSSSSDVGAIVGGVVGGAAALAIVAALAVLWHRRRQAQAPPPAHEADLEKAKTATDALATTAADGASSDHATDSGAEGSGPSAPDVPAAAPTLALVLQPTGCTEEISSLTLGSHSTDMAGALCCPAPHPPPGALFAGATPASPRGPANVTGPGMDSAVDDVMGRIRQMVAHVEASLPPPEKDGADSRPRAPKCLGRGAFGVVYLGSFRGLPAAIKVINFDANNPRGRDKVANEVALSMALTHPCLVPTYHFDLATLALDASGTETELGEGSPGAGKGSPLYNSPARGSAAATSNLSTATGLRLKIIMQYCEGGNLASALRAGFFTAGPAVSALPSALMLTAAATPGPGGASWTSTQLPVTPSNGAPASPFMTPPVPPPPAPAPAPAPTPAPAPAPAPAAEGAPRDPAGATAPQPAPAGAELEGVPPAPSGGARLLSRADSGAAASPRAGGTGTGMAPGTGAGVGPSPPGGVGSAAPSSRPWLRGPSGADPRVGNLPLALLAAWDVARGLEYVHAAGVVHGDINDNNILLKVASPNLVWPPPQPSASPLASPLNASATRASNTATGPNALPPTASALAAAAVAAAAAARRGSAKGALQSGVSGKGGLPSGLSGIAWAGASGLPSGSNRASEDCGPGGSTAGGAGMSLLSSWAEVEGLSGALSSSAVIGASRLRGALEAAAGMLGTVFKIGDMGLAVQLSGATHLSNLMQGTPFFAAPEVLLSGHLSPAADIYSFGVVLWLLLHGTSMAQVRPMLPRVHLVSAAPTLLARAHPDLPEGARRLLAECLAHEPALRPTAAALRQRVRELMQDVAGTELAALLLATERREVVLAEGREA